MENMTEKDLAIKMASSVAAPKEEGLNIPWDSDYYESRIKELKEALKDLLPVAEKGATFTNQILDYTPNDKEGIDEQQEMEAIIERARNTLSKEF